MCPLSHTHQSGGKCRAIVDSNMMSPEVLEAENRALADKRAGEKQSINPTNSEEELKLDVGIQIVDSRDDLFAEQEDQYPSSNNESVKEKEVADVQTQYEAAAAVGRDDKGSADAQMVKELREALLKVRETNRHLQNENDHIKEEYISLADVAHKMAEDWATLREENEQLRKELETLKTGKADSTPLNDITSSTLSEVSSASTSLKGDCLLDFDDSSHANELHSLPFTIDADFQYIPIAQQGSVDSDDVLDNEETVKFIDRPSNINSHSRNMSDLSLSLKSRDALYDIDELKITTTNDGDDEDVTLRMKLELKRDECNELQKDLEKIAEAFWQQTEELTECQSRIVKLQTENDELRCLKWIETEVDTMWSHVKEMDEVKDVCDHLLAENDELKASVNEKSNEIAELKLVQSKVDGVQEDLEALLLELKASLVEKTNEIEELKEQHRNAPCPDWVQSSIDEIREDLEVILAEREQLQATVVRKSHEIADLKEQLRNANERT
jgi:chromosome segregation ATPase